MTNEDWKYIEDTLSHVGSAVYLEIDNYLVTLVVEPYKKLQNCIAVYVNDKIRTDWILNECEIRRKFYQRHTKCLAKIDRKKLERASKNARKMVEQFRKENTYEYFEPYWMTFNTMKRHFIKNNVSIQLFEGTYEEFRKKEIDHEN